MEDLPPEAHLDIFLRSHHTVYTRLWQVFEAAGAVQASEARVLAALVHAEGDRMRIDALSAALHKTKSSVSRTVDKLERDGYVERLTSSHDRRAIYAAITSEGRDALRHATHVFRSVFEDIFLSGLTKEELNLLSSLLERVNRANLPSAAPAAPQEGVEIS